MAGRGLFALSIESFSFGPEGVQRGGGRGGFRSRGGSEDILTEAFGGLGGRGSRAGSEFHFDAEDLVSGGSGDIAATLTVTLSEAAKGAKKRMLLPTGKEVEVKIPSGIADGQQIRLKGQGIAEHAERSEGSSPPRQSARVTRAGPASAGHAPEAVLGAKVRVPTLSGAVELAIPAGTNAGRTFRLKGKGFPGKDATGDLLAAVRIVLPDRLDPELEELMRKWREGKPYDPRKGME